MTTTPKIMEIPQGHVTWKQVETKFNKSWRPPNKIIKPTIRHIYKIVESAMFLNPYNTYRKRIGNECFRYHGTTRLCQLGNTGQTTLCNLPECAVCNILRTSFSVELANPSGAYVLIKFIIVYMTLLTRTSLPLSDSFGAGIYTSSASNKFVIALPSGYDSVVFDRMNGQLNETIVYANDAIRPVYLIIF
ncbi:predicted protein [Postia placenta Mad-698-R]|uniref:Uncharacterized protein n=1 Tax=Postia placenta MAD-698-R-SB12 TaxID=670580 RepID=A0A1X6MKB5_9APHY|nr:hypothetical protein POSPLADRAFT_1158841 [Postia placenta MAD-698-R-SB12]EED81335.1 predicted protein [Postia placenta Mad-698-R]OSX56867.1 hypothetical protein POSPLADRAFT_1158841 [Postia placenta MAD-698-R-SB12]